MLKPIIYSMMLFVGTTAMASAAPLTLMGEYKRHDLRAASVCIAGHLVVIAHSDVGKGGGLAMMQLEHIVDGQRVPMKCDPSASETGKSKKR